MSITQYMMHKGYMNVNRIALPRALFARHRSRHWRAPRANLALPAHRRACCPASSGLGTEAEPLERREGELGPARGREAGGVQLAVSKGRERREGGEDGLARLADGAGGAEDCEAGGKSCQLRAKRSTKRTTTANTRTNERTSGRANGQPVTNRTNSLDKHTEHT